MNVLKMQEMKDAGQLIALVTCYDHWSAKILNETDVDGILVGDSVAMVCHGLPSTLSATPEMVAMHLAAVSRGAPDKFLVGDMPFPSFRSGISTAMECVDLFMKAGANAVKVEGVDGHEDVIETVVQSGIPVMGHLGLTPQWIHRYGGYKVQSRGATGREAVVKRAKQLEAVGCFGIVLEAIPAEAARAVTEAIAIPTIGIGAGPHTSGQVLVLQDLLGLTVGFKPKFVRTFANGADMFTNAIAEYVEQVRSQQYPSADESYKT